MTGGLSAFCLAAVERWGRAYADLAGIGSAWFMGLLVSINDIGKERDNTSMKDTFVSSLFGSGASVIFGLCVI